MMDNKAMKFWGFKKAKLKLSQLVNDVLTNSQRLFSKKNRDTFNEFMNKSPLKGLDLDFSRTKSFNREIEL